MIDRKNPLLVVEDSDEDFEIISSCLEEAGLRNDLIHFRDGDELLNFLAESRKEKKSKPAPAAILLDLNLPGMSGHSVLDEVRRDPVFGITPVIVLSTSHAARDINLAYQRGANSYLVKPLSLDSFQRLMQTFHRFWFESVVPPQSAFGTAQVH